MKLRLSTALLMLLVTILSVGCPKSEERPKSVPVGSEDGHEQFEPGELEDQEPLEFDEEGFVEQPE
jgi:hypothetical protein